MDEGEVSIEATGTVRTFFRNIPYSSNVPRLDDCFKIARRLHDRRYFQHAHFNHSGCGKERHISFGPW